ncbi:probable inactive ATP-dependent zinc metalloprotease FTSHI 3, chloroplastic [Cornus florida]|uniref:probable inactive ATP-dependent zinc metalloprotease FTSHI 3, chloroplastic n=1 Tax=Cornus florida TaxID=4283 RepID=UPI00289CF1F2|nr:probable inactive ATP-dependent zinc metalloprotease FTSHI 3, chloroplastic [Cornus florida]
MAALTLVPASGILITAELARRRHFERRLDSNTKIRALNDEKSGDTETQLGKTEDKETQLGKTEDNQRIKRFSLRLSERLRKLKSISIGPALNGLETFLRKNMKTMAVCTSISVALGLCCFFLKLKAMPSSKQVPYSNLIKSLESGEVEGVQFEEGSPIIYFNTEERIVENENHQSMGGVVLRMLTRTNASNPEWQYSTRIIENDERVLLSYIKEKGITYSSAPQPVLISIRSGLTTILLQMLHMAPYLWICYLQLNTGKSSATKRRPSKQTVRFDDVQGVDNAKAELLEMVSCLQGAINYEKLGARLPKGVLLSGPPGTGKTLLARAVAGEAGVPFYSTSASEFTEIFVGTGAARVRDIFKEARNNAPSIIFIDEIDSVGGKRETNFFNNEHEHTLNQLLSEMDGFNSDTKVIVIAATNRPEALDAALCRPGRLSRKVHVGEPDEVGRRKILAVHLREVPLEEDTGLICNRVASVTQGFVGAALANVTNEAALLAARRGSECVSMEDIMEAIKREKFGIKDSQSSPSTISKELGKLLPWMPSLKGWWSDTRRDGMQGLVEYQTLH